LRIDGSENRKLGRTVYNYEKRDHSASSRNEQSVKIKPQRIRLTKEASSGSMQ
jgi:hypothetical protein